MRQRFVIGLVVLSLAGVWTTAAAGEPAPQATLGKWGIETDSFSTTVKPGDDFYLYVNEGWLKTAKIPVGLDSYDDPTKLYLGNQDRINEIIKTVLVKPYPNGSDEQQIADTYRAYFDVAAQDRRGLEPIRGDLAAIARVKTRTDLAILMATPWQGGPFASGVLPNAADPQHYIAAVVQSGLTLPSDYYLAAGEPYATNRVQLKAYIADLLSRAGVKDAGAKAGRIVALEIEIAKLHWTAQQRRDVVKMFHPMLPDELASFAPGFDWPAYLKARGFGGISQIDVGTDTAVQGLARLFAATPVDVWKDYLTFHQLDNWAENLGADWQEAHFDFYSRKLRNVPQQRTLEERAVEATNAAVSQQIGKIFARQYFPATYRAQVDEMVGYIRQSFAYRIDKLPWMDAPTKSEARAKLAKVASHIGYPDQWHDYSSIEIRPDDPIGNAKRTIEWSRADEIRQLGETRRDWEWPYPPQEINAGYVPSLNSITFPAGILQPPFFDPAADPAVNFGAIAAVIGHEFGHGFDDQGSRSYGDGKLRDWWTAGSRAEFERRTEGLVEQYNAYEPVPGVHINGRQNLGENIGDLGGLSIAYAAYRRFVDEKQGGKAPVIDGFTGDQRFFLSWGQVWRGIRTEAEERRRVLTDNHSATRFRVNGVARNVDAWYVAFDVKPGDKLYLPPEQRVKIW